MSDIYIQAQLLAFGLFAIGLVIAIVKRNAIFTLMGIELMLNGAHLNLVIHGHKWQTADAQMMVIFTVVLAAAEVAVGLALLLHLYRFKRSADLNDFDETGH